MTKWVRTTIKEPFPVFYAHVARKTERRPETAKGPFYEANSEHFHIYPDELAWREKAAEHLRKDGWTVTVDIIDR